MQTSHSTTPRVLTVTHLPVRSRHDMQRIIFLQSNSFRMQPGSLKITEFDRPKSHLQTIPSRCRSLSLPVTQQPNTNHVVSISGSASFDDQRNMACLDCRYEMPSRLLSFFDRRSTSEHQSAVIHWQSGLELSSVSPRIHVSFSRFPCIPDLRHNVRFHHTRHTSFLFRVALMRFPVLPELLLALNLLRT